MPDDTNSVPLTTLTAPQQGTSMAENNYNTANPSDNLTPTPQSQPQGQPAQPQPSPQQAAQQAAQQTGNARHAALGKVTSFLLGKQYDYQVDPNTGKTVAVPIKQEPGQMFRSILAGAILGGAAAKGQTDITTGFLSGGEAEIKDQRAQDQQRLSRAQEQFKQQQQAAQNAREERASDRADEEFKQQKVQFQAQQAHWEIENMHNERDANLRTLEFNQRLNESNQQMESHILEAGGYMAPWTKNGQVGNGAEGMKAVTTNDPNLQAPNGYIRQVVKTSDLSGLTYDDKKGYVDAEGKPVDLSTRDKWSVYFTPINGMKQVEMVKGSQLMSSYPHIYAKGSLSADKEYPISLNERTGIASKEAEISRTEHNEALARKKEDVSIIYDSAKTNLASAREDMNNIQKEASASGQDFTQRQDYLEAQKREKEAIGLMNGAVSQLSPELRKYLPVPEVTPPPAPPPPATPTTFGDKPVEKPAAQVREEQRYTNQQKQEALTAAGPMTPRTSSPYEPATKDSAIPKEIPLDKAQAYAKAAGMTDKEYRDLAEKNGHTIVNAAPIVKSAFNPQKQPIQVRSLDGGKTWTEQSSDNGTTWTKIQ